MNGPNAFLLFFLLPFIGYVLTLSSFSMTQFLKHLNPFMTEAAII